MHKILLIIIFQGTVYQSEVSVMLLCALYLSENKSNVKIGKKVPNCNVYPLRVVIILVWHLNKWFQYTIFIEEKYTFKVHPIFINGFLNTFWWWCNTVIKSPLAKTITWRNSTFLFEALEQSYLLLLKSGWKKCHTQKTKI